MRIVLVPPQDDKRLVKGSDVIVSARRRFSGVAAGRVDSPRFPNQPAEAARLVLDP